jgi:hypothetical protein
VDKLAKKLLASCEARSPADFIPKHQHIPPVLAFGKRFPKFSVCPALPNFNYELR